MDNAGIKYGVYVGGISIVLGMVFYLIDTELFFHWGKALLGFVVLVWGMVMAGKAFVAKNEGYGTWKEVLKPTFLVGIISGFIGIVFEYIMYNVVDTSLVEIQKEFAIKMIEGFEGSVSEEAFEKMMDNLDAQTFGMTPALAFQSLMMIIIFSFLIAAVVSLIVKRNRPADQIV